MGGIVAHIRFDQRGVSEHDVRALCAPAEYRGRAGITAWTSGPAGLGHLADAAAPAGDRQPLVSPDGLCAITFDGRIDNREELQRRLDTGRAPDAALVLAAYRTWDSRAPEHLLGDFSFAIWDGRLRRLFCARDPLGIRPFYYWSGTRQFVCASDLGQLLGWSAVPIEPNPGMIAEHLADAIHSQDETVYAGILRLPHGQSLTVTPRGETSRQCYWTIDAEHSIACRTDAEYAARFDEVFTDAVRCRMPDESAAAIYLSGGIDSSAVTTVAREVSSARLAPEAFSLVFGDDPERDEIKYINDVCRHSGVRSHVTRAEHAPCADDTALPRDVFDMLRDLPALAWKRQIRARGFRVALTGQGGDHGLYGSRFQYADLLRAGRVVALVRQWRADRRMPDSGATASDLIKSGMWPLLPPAAQRLLRPLARRVAGVHVVPRWIPNGFARAVNLDDRLRPALDAWTGGSAAGWDTRRNYESGWVCMGLETAEREAASLDLEERHPFYDRRVVEFASALPDDQRWRGELTRVVVRRALADRLAPSVRTRTSSGDGSWRVAATVNSMAARRVFDAMCLADSGWISQSAVTSMLCRMRQRIAAGDPRYVEDAFPLWIAGGTERWFRARFKTGYTGFDRRAGA